MGALRGTTLGVRVNPTERAQVERKAAAAGMTPAQFIRAAALGCEIAPAAPKVNRSAWLELIRLAENLNDVVDMIKNGARVGIDSTLAEEMLEAMRGLRCALLGNNELEGCGR